MEKKGFSMRVMLDKYGVVFKAFGGDKLPLLVVIDKKSASTFITQDMLMVTKKTI